MFDNKVVLITGGTGSLGNALVSYLLNHTKAEKIIVFSRDELKQFHMQKAYTDDRLRFFLGDIREKDRLMRAFHGVDIIIHTAALKQVPILEYNPFEAVKTNVLGTQNVIDAAIDQGVEKVLLISTDKASQPINLYGSTKLTAEKLIVAGNAYGVGKTLFSAVRYGNVVGSRGSIVDLLLKNPNQPKVSITHPDMTRFWITLDQAVELVAFAVDQMEGGEIFIPKIPSMNLKDMFDVLAPQSEKEVTGIRPGEKIHESLLTEDEARHSYELENHFVILPEFLFFAEHIYSKYRKHGKSVAEGFRYSSDKNDDWLTHDRLKDIFASLNKS